MLAYSGFAPLFVAACIATAILLTKKLLLVSDTFYPKVDGTVKFIEEFIRRTNHFFNLSLLVPDFGKHKSVKNVNAYYLKVSRIIKPLPTYPAIKFSISNLSKIKKAVKGVDIVFAQGPALASLLAIRYARKYKKKTFFYTHVLPWELLEKSKRNLWSKLAASLVRRVSMHFYNKCDKVLVPYHDLKDQLQKNGVKADIAIARLGIDIERFFPTKDKATSKKKIGLDENKLVVGYVGRISKEKNTEILLEAFQKLNDQNNITLLMVGDGHKDLVSKFKEIKNCKITGFVNNVEDYLKAMDVFVMPSLTETTSLATLEAMSSGLAVIATKVGFIKNYIVRNHNGVFFPRNSSTMLAIKIEKLLKNEQLMEKLTRNARKTVAYSFSWERSINKIKRLLTE